MTKLQKILTWMLLIVALFMVALMIYALYDGGWIFRGDTGPEGAQGVAGKDGKSAYDLAVEDGFRGSLHEWLVSLAVPGKDGAPGQAGQQGAQGAPGTPGVSVTDVKINEKGHLIVTLSNGTLLDAGYVGKEGFVTDEVDDMGFTLTYEQVIMNGEAGMLTLRSQPDITSAPAAYIQTGTELLRIGHNKTTGWTRLVYNDPDKGEITGYAKAKYFDLKYIYEGDTPEMHLPEKMFLTVNETFWFITDAVIADAKEDFTLAYSYKGEGKRTYDGGRAFAITPTKTGDATLTVTLQKREKGELREIDKRTVAISVVDSKRDLTLTGIVIGDSRISDGTLVTQLTNHMPNLTLLGTRTVSSSGINHEGRGGWSTANFLKSQSVTIGSTTLENAFYNPQKSGFDFAYYMNTHQAGKHLDFVVINLGANDGFSATSVDNLAAMVASVKAYDASVKVIVMTEYLSPESGYYITQSGNTDIVKMRARQFAYFNLLTTAFAERESEGIYLLPNYVCIDEWNDRLRHTADTPTGQREVIFDVIHLGREGYIKEALAIEALLFGTAG